MNGNSKMLAPAIFQSRARVLDYLELMKPELTSLSVLTALCGFCLASQAAFDVSRFLQTAVGTLLVGGGAGALNQYIERKYDALMKRTERRPLPSGRLSPIQALVFGIGLSSVGILQLTLFTNLLTGFLAILTFVTYLFLYTPLKRVTPYATLVGGIPGALPPMMGWTAVRNEVSLEAWILFAILFCWQMPHFLSLAWMYRKDYARAGFKMMTVTDQHGDKTARHIVIFCIALIPATLLTAVVGLTGLLYLLGASVLGLTFLAFGIFFAYHAGDGKTIDPAKTNFYSRRIFFASLLYLPALMCLMVIDKV